MIFLQSFKHAGCLYSKYSIGSDVKYKKVFSIRRFSEIEIEIVEWMNNYIPQKT